MRKRLIPLLLVDANRRLVKTVAFGERTYVGDPFNVVRLFNEKEVDEICVLDIDAGIDQRGPDLDFIGQLASECFMPLAYGGGITELAHCEALNRLGVEKFVLGNSALDQNLIRSISRDFGAQALAACVDIRGVGAGARCFTRSARQPTGRSPLQFCRELQELGVGEVILQSVDRDGSRTGMDLELIGEVSHSLTIPVVALGGAGELQHLVEALSAGASAVASGSAFVFIGRLRAVLVTYPSSEQIDALGSIAA
ncbi:MAG TPA: HisA/HisF-related TIM barrel protein [Burkholderiaceae bacterium]|nr:HisA/HisF-related TIM barrel protein [Burkholderiaceae bacterium]